MHKVVALLLMILTPSLAMSAGFAKDPIFLSRTPVMEGQSVRIFAIATNNDNAAFAGMMVFYDKQSKIGEVPVSLASGATQTVSIPWLPSGGSHNISAKLVAKDGAVSEEISKTFTIQEKPKPAATSSSQSAAAIDSSKNIQDSIAGVSPQVAGASEPIFKIIDGARGFAADFLDKQIDAAKKKVGTTPKPGVTLGSSDTAFSDVKVENGATGFWYWLYSAYLYILQALRWLVGSAAILYPFIALLFLYSIWRMYRRFRR